MSDRTVIVDYQLCNLDSIARAAAKCGGDVIIAEDPAELANADRVILPGVGAFGEAMNILSERGWIGPLNERIVEDELPFLGICLGMQLIAERGAEGSGAEGLGWISGAVEQLDRQPGERLPHMGWNEVDPTEGAALFTGVPEKTDFYFVHSFQLECAEDSDVIATTPYGGGFVSSVARGNIMGVQFHPEKSQKSGFKVLRNFLSL